MDRELMLIQDNLNKLDEALKKLQFLSKEIRGLLKCDRAHLTIVERDNVVHIHSIDSVNGEGTHEQQ